MRFWITALLIVSASGCGRKANTPLRIGINPWPGYEFLFLAKQKGFLEQHGARVELLEYSSLGDVRRAFEMGKIDGMACTLIEVLMARENSPRLPRAFLVTDFSDGADVILADSKVSGIGGLKGKSIGAETASLGVFMLSRALERAGLALSDVALIPMDQAHMEKALGQGQVDAVITYPPESVKILAKGKANRIFDSSLIPGEVIDVVALDAAILAAREREVAGILRAWDQALAYAARHPEESYALMARRERISPEEFRKALEGIRVLSTSEQRSWFEPGGKLEVQVRAVDRTLRGVGALAGPDVTGGVVAGAPLRLAAVR